MNCKFVGGRSVARSKGNVIGGKMKLWPKMCSGRFRKTGIERHNQKSRLKKDCKILECLKKKSGYFVLGNGRQQRF